MELLTFVAVLIPVCICVLMLLALLDKADSDNQKLILHWLASNGCSVRSIEKVQYSFHPIMQPRGTAYKLEIVAPNGSVVSGMARVDLDLSKGISHPVFDFDRDIGIAYPRPPEY